MSESTGENRTQAADFETRARTKQPGLLRELWDFLKTNKKWWLLPILLIMLLLAVLVVLSSTAVGPFIYTLF